MKSILYYTGAILATGVSLSQAAAANACSNNGNNCARAVTGTAKPTPNLASKKADCSSFFQYTYTPPTVTSTVFVSVTPVTNTQTVVVTATQTSLATVVATVTGNNFHKRVTGANTGTTAMPSSIPAYASPCTDAAAYSSVCYCWGVTTTVSTAPAPTTTVVSTLTFTASATVVVTSQVTETQTVTSTTTVPKPYMYCSSPFLCRVTSTVSFCNPSDTTEDCFCAGTPESSQGTCISYDRISSCSATPACTASSDCGAEQVCWTGSCCGHGICADVGTCADNFAPSRLFRKREEIESWDNPFGEAALNLPQRHGS